MVVGFLTNNGDIWIALPIKLNQINMKNKPRILIVDDNNDLLIGMKLFLSPHAGDVTTLRNPNLIPTTLRQGNFDLVLLDMNFTAGVNTGNEGLYWLKRILETDPLATVVMLTGFGDIELAVKAMKEGAADFIQKSWDEEKMLSSILTALKLRESKLEIKSLQSKKQHLTQQVLNEAEICPTESPLMQKVMQTIGKVSKTDANILITGENGTGKEIAARQIHMLSHRRDEMFVSVDLASLAETLFESELFGHKKGAFTDALEDKTGHMELADGGTLFLDEIGNLSLSMQAKILTSLQNRELIPLGSTKRIPVDIRLICATNMSLDHMVETGHFRQDLLYRINTIQIELPPLRKRKEDIPVLVRFFLAKYARKYRKEIPDISSQGMNRLVEHQWPGNVRELQHAIEKAIILSDKDQLGPEDFSFSRSQRMDPELSNFNLAENEKIIIAMAIEKYRGNVSNAAKSLGINRSTLYEKIRRYGL
jgi:DNA-binding NtrC family response regulator